MQRRFLAIALLLVAPSFHTQRASAAPPQAPAPAAPAAAAATPVPATPEAIQLFRAKLPGGSYEVAVRSIISVSSHEYVVDGVARVTEVNIDTVGSMVVRFYFIEPNASSVPSGIGAGTLEKAQQLLTEGAERTGQDVWKKVVKSYPTTTHARTIEFRLESKEALAKIYTAAETALRLQRSQNVE